MSDDTFDSTITFVAGCAAATVIWAACLAWQGRRWQRDAVNVGAAEFYLDANHERQWRWKTNTHEAARTTNITVK